MQSAALLCDCSGDRAAAVEAYKKVEETAAGSGLKMDNVFTMLRCPVRGSIVHVSYCLAAQYCQQCSPIWQPNL